MHRNAMTHVNGALGKDERRRERLWNTANPDELKRWPRKYEHLQALEKLFFATNGAALRCQESGCWQRDLLTRTCKKNGPRHEKLLAMTINSNMNVGGGVSLGTISRNYESVGNRSVYPYFERLLRPALRRDGLPFQRNSGECSVYSQ